MRDATTLIATPRAKIGNFLKASRLKISDTPTSGKDTPLSAGKSHAHVIFRINRDAGTDRSEPDFERLSIHAPLLVLDIAEIAGTQTTRFFEGGNVIWSVTFSKETEDFLTMSGQVPVDMERLTDEARARSAAGGGDVLYAANTPVYVFRELTGFALDESNTSSFRVVTGNFPGPKPWWRFW